MCDDAWTVNLDANVPIKDKTYEYSKSASKGTYGLAFDTFFTDNSGYCPATSCILLDDACITFLEPSSPVWIETSSGNLMMKLDNLRGFS